MGRVGSFTATILRTSGVWGITTGRKNDFFLVLYILVSFGRTATMQDPGLCLHIARYL